MKVLTNARNTNNLRYAEDTTLMAESEEELKSLLITSRQSRFDAQYSMLGAGALGRPRGRVWGGRREEGEGFRMGNTCIPVADSF